MFTRLDTLIIRVRDRVRSRAWYETALGLQSVYDDEAEGLSVLGLDGTSLTLWELRAGEELAAGGVGSYPIFAVTDAAAAHSVLKERGVQVGPLRDGTGVRFFDFHDPDGNRLEACEVLG